MSENRYFKRGYACQKCVEEQRTPQNEPPLYTRLKGVFKFSGLVLCSEHGVTNAVKLMDVA